MDSELADLCITARLMRKRRKEEKRREDRMIPLFFLYLRLPIFPQCE